MNTFRSAIVIILCSLWLMPVTGCNKKNDSQIKNQPVPGTTYHITISGDPYKNLPISFNSDVPAGIDCRWQFGDGDTSTSAQPSHIYDSARKFYVTLVLNNDARFTFKDSIIIGLHKFDLLPGTKTWHHTYTASTPGPVTTYTKSDTSLSITYIDPITVKIDNDTLTYQPNLSTGANPDSAISFCKPINTYPNVTWPVYTLIYNYISNRASYRIFWGTSTGAAYFYHEFTTP